MVIECGAVLDYTKTGKMSTLTIFELSFNGTNILY